MQTREATKIALVSGGSGGIGRAICVELSQNGCFVYVNYMKNRAGAEETLAELVQAGGAGEPCPFDVRDTEGAATAVNRIAERHGRLDILINNAGVVDVAADVADEVFLRLAMGHQGARR